MLNGTVTSIYLWLYGTGNLMIIKDVVNLAKYSELSGVAAKNDTEVIVAFINLGILELYKRFPIKVSEVIIELLPGTMYYSMPEDFMYYVSAYGEKDINNPDKDIEITINGSDTDSGIFFNDWSTVQVPSSIIGSRISILYVSKPTAITVADAEDGTTSLSLPDALVDALLSYVGYRAYLGIKSDAQSENNAHWARFERSCNKARALGVAVPSDSINMPDRLLARGFV